MTFSVISSSFSAVSDHIGDKINLDDPQNVLVLFGTGGNSPVATQSDRRATFGAAVTSTKL